ncbi:MAG: ABC transporter permease [Muribaculaceae bacterium]|nr:ABC transporter permease [Muribaculaceae bacterium]
MKKIKTGIGTLLYKNISKGQLLGYSCANVIGLTVILCSVLFYCDSRHNLNKEDKFFSDDYIVITKKVKGINLEPVAFTQEEIEKISQQPWVKKLGGFASADFSVGASVDMGGKGMSTYLFLESVPDEFFDLLPQGWTFDEHNNYVPIVLNKDYLALYNFGFAIPQGLPQLSEDMIGTVPLKLIIRGENGRNAVFNASVVGFSSRLNTIAVPQNFMDWANSRFSDNNDKKTSRLIIKLDRLNSSGWEQFLADEGYEIAGDKEGDSKISNFLSLISGVVAANGVVICLLALFILILSIFLLLQKSRPMLRNLILLGFSPLQPSRYYEGIVLKLNSLITLFAVGLTFICRMIWTSPLGALGLGHGNVLFMLATALIYFILVSVLNIMVIRKHLWSIWLPKD